MVTVMLFILGLLNVANSLEDSSKYITVSIHSPRLESPALYIERHSDLISLEEQLSIGGGERLAGDLTRFEKNQYYLFKIQSHKSLNTVEVSKVLSIGILRYSEAGWKIIEIDSGTDSEYDFTYTVIKE